MDETHIIITKAIGAGLRASLFADIHNPMFEAFLEHYAQFIESQTGTPAADTIAAIKATAAKNEAAFKEQVESILVDAIK